MAVLATTSKLLEVLSDLQKRVESSALPKGKKEDVLAHLEAVRQELLPRPASLFLRLKYPVTPLTEKEWWGSIR